jgi:hypothetical protein
MASLYMANVDVNIVCSMFTNNYGTPLLMENAEVFMEGSTVTKNRYGTSGSWSFASAHKSFHSLKNIIFVPENETLFTTNSS